MITRRRKSYRVSTVLDAFISFLKSRDAYEAWCTEAEKKWGASLWVYIATWIENGYYDALLGHAFTWDKTPQGNELWSEMHSDWCEMCSRWK